ncbi:MAG: alpha/beta family hydrolase [Rhizobacter sp.]
MPSIDVTAQPSKIAVPGHGHVSTLLMVPPDAHAAFVFAHGAGAGMHHSFMAALAGALAERGIATLRFQFPFMENGSKRPDVPAVAQATVRAAVAEARRRLPGVPLFAGGKSFGGRMSSQAQAESVLEGVSGLIFVGFPLHPAGKPDVTRAAHLGEVQCPMLFLQGTRDALAELPLLRSVLEPLGARASLAVFDDADHAFHVRVRSGTTDAAVLLALADRIEAWVGSTR